jgi:hypothetical protein
MGESVFLPDWFLIPERNSVLKKGLIEIMNVS